MKRAERGWITVFLLLSMAFLASNFALQGSLLTAMIDHFHLDAGRQGLANTVAFAGGITALVSAFALQGRWKKRTLLKAAILLCAAGLMLMWAAPDYWLYLVAWFVTGFGLGLMDTLLSACMADMYTGKTAVLMMCLLHTFYGLTNVLSPMLYSRLLNGGVSWKLIYFAVAAAGLVLLAVAFAVRRILRMTDRELLPDQPIRISRVLPTLRDGKLLWLTASIFFHGIFLSGLNTWINRYADTLNASIFLPAQSCVFLGVMLSRLLMAFLPVKTEKFVVVGGLAGSVVLFVGLLIPNGWVLRAALILAALLFGAQIPCVITLGCARIPSNTLLATTGIMLALYLGEGVSSPIIAALESLIHLQAGMLLCAVCIAICSLCCLTDAIVLRKASIPSEKEPA